MLPVLSAALLCSVTVAISDEDLVYRMKRASASRLRNQCQSAPNMNIDAKTKIDIIEKIDTFDFGDQEFNQVAKALWVPVSDHRGQAIRNCVERVESIPKKSDDILAIILKKSDEFNEWMETLLKDNTKQFLQTVTKEKSIEICSKLPKTINDIGNRRINDMVFQFVFFSGYLDTINHSVPEAKIKLDELISSNYVAVKNGDSDGIINGCEQVMTMLRDIDMDTEFDDVWGTIQTFYVWFGNLADPTNKGPNMLKDNTINSTNVSDTV